MSGQDVWSVRQAFFDFACRSVGDDAERKAGGQRFHDWVDRLVHTESESEVLELIDKATYEPQH